MKTKALFGLLILLLLVHQGACLQDDAVPKARMRAVAQDVPVDQNPGVPDPEPGPAPLPSVLSASIGAGPYYRGSVISVDVYAYDEGHGEPALEYAWYVNGELVEGARESSFALDTYGRGDQVFVRVSPFRLREGETPVAGLPYDSNSVTLSNTPPTSPGIFVGPGLAPSGTAVWASVITESTDADGDAVYYEYRWYRDGELQDFPADLTTVPGAHVTGGDAWFVTVTPYDAIEMGWAAAAAGPAVLFAPGERIAGAYHTCTRTSLKTVLLCWGKNDEGQLGNGLNTDAITPVSIVPGAGYTGPGQDEVRAVALGFSHSCALFYENGGANGKVRCWGRNDEGQLGVGDTNDRATPTEVPGLANPTAIAAGMYHTCAVLASKTVKCWGKNAFGQVGNGTQTDSLSPADVITTAGTVLNNVGQLAAGGHTTCVLLSTGAPYCWGQNSNNQVGAAGASKPAQTKAIAVGTPVVFTNASGMLTVGGQLACARANDAAQNLYCWGYGYGQVPVVASAGVLSASAGLSHVCAHTASMGVKCAGGNQNGQLGLGSTSPRPLTQFADVPGFTSGVQTVAAGYIHTCAQKGALGVAGGVLFCWGDNTYGQLGVGGAGLIEAAPASLAGTAVGVDAGDTSSCMVTQAGTAKCWGDRAFGQVGDGVIATGSPQLTPTAVKANATTELSGVNGIAVGRYHACALLDGGVVKCWGRGTEGQLGHGANTTQSYPVTVNGVFAVVAAGEMHSCAITTQGAVQCWGANTSGQLGNGTLNNSAMPVNVNLGGAKAVSLVAGKLHSCAALTDGGVRCWGGNNWGQLINGTTQRSANPVVSAVSGVRMLASHDSHGCFLTYADTLWCWGKNESGQVGDGSFTDRSDDVQVTLPDAETPAAVAAGSSHTCALARSGRVYCWGRNADGEVGDGTSQVRNTPTLVPEFSAGGAVAIAAGGSHTCALLVGGVLRCWGKNSEGQLGNNATTLSGTGDRPDPTQVQGHVSGITAIGTGDFHTCDVGNGGATALYCWGRNASMQLVDGTNLDRWGPVNAGGGQGSLIDGGAEHTCTIGTDGFAWCAGANTRGQRGVGSFGGPAGWGQVGGGGTINRLEAGGNHACSTKTGSNALQCWGGNESGQLGAGDTADRSAPVAINIVGTNPANPNTISVGYRHACLIEGGGTGNGRLYCWGWGGNGRLGLGNTNNYATPQYALSHRYHRLKERRAGLCMGTVGGGTADGTDVRVYSCSDAANDQYWFFDVGQQGFRLYKNNAMCLDHTGVYGDNKPVVLGNCSNTSRTQWVRWDDDVTIRPAGGTGNCIDAYSNTSGSDAGQWNCGALPGQRLWDSEYTTGAAGLSLAMNNSVVASGKWHTCVAGALGGVQCFGTGDDGALGNDGNGGDHTTPRMVRAPGNPAFHAPWNAVVTKMAAGENFTCAIASANLYCWGLGRDGRLGTGGTGNAKYPVLIASGGVTDVKAHAFHACMVQNGAAKCWGYNGGGQLGLNDTTNRTSPIGVEGPADNTVTNLGSNVKLVAAGYDHSCAVKTDNTVWCWGQDGYGQLGNGAGVANRALADTQVVGLPAGAVTQIGAGEFFTCALVDEQVYCWGRDNQGQLGNDAALADSGLPVLVKGPGGVGNLSGVKSLSVGYASACAVRHTGQTVCWGSDDSQMLGNSDGAATNQPMPTVVVGYDVTITPFAASLMAAGRAHTCAVQSGSLYCSGRNARGQLGTGDKTSYTTMRQVSGLASVSAIAAGDDHTCAIETNPGPVKCWGGNDDGQLGLGDFNERLAPTVVPGITTAMQVIAGAAHTCAILSDQTARCWGRNFNGQLGNQAAALVSSTPLPVKSGGVNLSGVLAMAAGTAHTCARLTGGAAKCWGAGGNGQIGDGVTGAPTVTPLDVHTPPGLVFSDVSMGTTHGCGVSMGAAFCWGDNSFNQTGDGLESLDFRGTPTPVVNLGSGVAAVSAGANYSCALTLAGELYCWGDNSHGQLGQPAGVGSTSSEPLLVDLGDAALAVAAGPNHACAIIDVPAGEDNVMCWGNNYQGQVNGNAFYGTSIPVVVPGVNHAVKIAAGLSQTCARTAAGELTCWGDNSHGQLGGNEADAVTATNMTHGLSQTVTVAPSTQYTLSFYAKNNGGKAASYSIRCVSTGTDIVAPTSYLDGLGADWTRVSRTFTTLSVCGSIEVYLLRNSGDGAKLSLWGAQLETGGAATLYSRAEASPSYKNLLRYSEQLENAVWSRTNLNITPNSLDLVTGPFDEVAVGNAHVCALKISGEVYCWGSDESGQVGNDTFIGGDVHLPALAAGLTGGVAKISASGDHTCALLTNGQVQCWGSNSYGESGGGVTASRPLPLPVPGMANGAVAVSAGLQATCAIDMNGALRCWGSREVGQIPLWGPRAALVGR